MRKMRWLICILPLALFLTEASARAEQNQAATVILLAWNGMRHDYPDRGDWPGLARMMAQGARADRLVPVYPPDTPTGYVSIATGTYPDKHGIVAGDFYDRMRSEEYADKDDASWIMAEPLWVAAERQGVIAAVYFWIGSQTPWRKQTATYYKAPFDGDLKERIKVDQILSWLDLPAAKRPRLIMSYWRGPDFLAHKQGPNHPAVLREVGRHDKQLQRLMRGLDERHLWPDTTLIVVSDHGMTEINKFINIERILSQADISARVVGGAGLHHIYIPNQADQDKALAILQTQPNLTVQKRGQLAPERRFIYAARTGDLVVTTEPPYSFIAPTAAQRAGHAIMAATRGWRLGMHGYDATHPDMGGILLALGRGAPAGMRINNAHQTDVAVTVTHLLGIQPPASAEGKVLLPVPIGKE